MDSELVGLRLGNLVVTKITEEKYHRVAECICDCGGTRTSRLDTLKASVKAGKKPSCLKCVNAVRSVVGTRRFDFTKYNKKRFGSLVVTGVSYDADRPQRKHRLVCMCDCGSQTITSASDLVSGNAKSCGCSRISHLLKLIEENTRHGHTIHGDVAGRTSLYMAWVKIRAGCAEGWKKDVHKVCHDYDKRWDDFVEFFNDFGPIDKKHTISRIDNQLSWCKDNCYVNVGQRGTYRERKSNGAMK